jgi:hypothetical protein
MSFSFSINCINYHEPLLWLSLLLGAAVGWLIAALLLRLVGQFNLSKLFTTLIATGGAPPTAMLSSFIALAVLYGVVRGGSVCIHFVRPAFVLPAAFTVLSVLWSGLRNRPLRLPSQ